MATPRFAMGNQGGATPSDPYHVNLCMLSYNTRFYTLADLPALMGALDFIYNQLQAQLLGCVS